jgi:hypothetical protein
MIGKYHFNQYIGNFKSKSMEKVKEFTRVNVMALSEKEKESPDGVCHRVISVQQSPQSTYALNKKTTEYVVCLNIRKPDDDPEDTGIEGIHLYLEGREELDKFIKALQALRSKIWTGVFKELE